jgi:phenylacetic acid degradation protein PaaD
MGNLEIAQQCAAAMMARDRSSQAMGITIEIPKAGQAIARMLVRDDMTNGFDVLHGGVTFALADTAFAFACNAYNKLTFAASANIEFLRPAMLGDELTASAIVQQVLKTPSFCPKSDTDNLEKHSKP